MGVWVYSFCVLWAGVGVKLRLLTDLIESTFDFSSVASAMKEDVWQTYVHSSYIAMNICMHLS